MWNIDMIEDILKENIEGDAYVLLKDRRRAAALCADLLVSFDEERRVLTMLLREGIGDCLSDSPYHTSHAIMHVKSRVRKFALDYGINEIVADSVAEILVNICTSEEHSQVRAEDIFKKNQQEEMQNKIHEEDMKGKEYRIETTSDLIGIDPSRVESLVFSFLYKKELPALREFSNLKRFISFASAPLEKYYELDMSGMDELYISVSGKQDISINAPVLRKLEICIDRIGFDELDPGKEKKLEELNTLDISRASQITDLKLMHFDGFDFTPIGQCRELKLLHISCAVIPDFSWLSECTNLESLIVVNSYIQNPEIPVLPK